MDVRTVRKTRINWVRKGKCTQRPRKNISVSKATTWGSSGSTNSNHRWNQTSNWNSSFDNDNLLSTANIVGRPKNPPSSRLWWMTPFLAFWKLIFTCRIIFTPTSKKCHPFFVTLKSSLRTWMLSCSSMSEIVDCRTNRVACSSAAWERTRSCYLPLTWNGCCRKDSWSPNYIKS